MKRLYEIHLFLTNAQKMHTYQCHSSSDFLNSHPGPRGPWWVQGLAGLLCPPRRVRAPPAVGMLRKSSSSGGGGNKRNQGLPRHLTNPHTGSLSAGSTKTWDMGHSSKNRNPLSSIGISCQLMGAPGVDPDYVMQLVNDVRKFADVLLNLKEAFQLKGGFRMSWNARSPPHSVHSRGSFLMTKCASFYFSDLPVYQKTQSCWLFVTAIAW